MLFSQIISYLFLATAFVQIIYWGIIFSRLAFYKVKENKKSDIPISVVICAFNEAENLEQHLTKILEQDYKNFEVFLVNDASTDGTKEKIIELQKKYTRLNALHLEYPEGKKSVGKKNALSQGIRHCQYENILVTDADCHPISKDWIRIMASGLEGDTKIGLAYGPYEERKGWLNLFIRFETIYAAIQYLSLSLWGQAYMGVGRNMIYKKELFYKVGGFKKHEHLASGDDDLFVNEISNGTNTEIIIHKDSFMYSPPKENLKEYYRQKSRHLTTGRHYRPLHQAILGLLSLSHFGFYIFGLIAVFGFSTIIAVYVFLITLLLKTTIFAIIANKLNERRIIPYFLLLDVIYILYYIIFTPALAWGKTKEWK